MTVHPTLQKLWRFGIAGLAAAEVLSQIPRVCWLVSLITAIVAAGLIIASWGLSRMWFFSPIRITNAYVYIDTMPLRRIIAGQPDEFREPYLAVEITFILFWGEGVIDSKIEIAFPEQVSTRLNYIVSIPKHCRLNLSRQPLIELKRGIPESFQSTRFLPLKVETNQSSLSELFVSELDEISEQIALNNFQIIWRTALGKRSVYKPKKIKI